MRKHVAIWISSVLPKSETFIASQTGAFQRYGPIFFCKRRENQDTFPLQRVVSLDDQSRVGAMRDQVTYSVFRRSTEFQRVLHELKPALIHAHFGHNGVYALPFKQHAGITLVTTFHGLDAWRIGRMGPTRRPRVGWMLYRRYLNDLIQQGDLFLAVSDPVRNQLLAAGFPADRTLVHYIGVDLEKFPDSYSLRQAQAKKIVTVARLVEKKGIDDVIRALAIVVDKSPTVTLEIVGEGPLRPFLEGLVRDLGLVRHVKFLGALSPRDVQKTLSDASVFCLPSKTASTGDAEGLPVSILEAMAKGLPIVSTYHSGIPEAVSNGVSGLLVTEGDYHQLASALSTILSEPNRALAYGAASRMIVESRFALAAQSNKLENLYDNLVHEAHS